MGLQCRREAPGREPLVRAAAGAADVDAGGGSEAASGRSSGGGGDVGAVDAARRRHVDGRRREAESSTGRRGRRSSRRRCAARARVGVRAGDRERAVAARDRRRRASGVSSPQSTAALKSTGVALGSGTVKVATTPLNGPAFDRLLAHARGRDGAVERCEDGDACLRRSRRRGSREGAARDGPARARGERRDGAVGLRVPGESRCRSSPAPRPGSGEASRRRRS